MTSAIDVTVPVFGNPTTESVRANHVIIAREIGELQDNSATRAELANYLPLAGGALTGPLLLQADPAQPLGAATRAYVDAGDAASRALALPLAGGTLTGPLLLAGAPTAALGAATRNYVDDAIGTSEGAAGGRFLAIGGGALTGPLLLSADPVESRGAATKNYVDDTISGVAGITEAPRDGFSYGRGDGMWSRALPLAGGTLTGGLTINDGSDGLRVIAPGGQFSRVLTEVSGARTWSAGTGPGGGFNIADETAGANRFSIGLDGAVSLGSALWLAGTTFGLYDTGASRVLQWAGNGWADVWRNADGLRSWQTAGGGGIMTLSGGGDLWAAGSLQAREINAFSGGGWDGSVLRIGAHATAHWQMFCDAQANFYLRRSDVLGGISIVGGQDLNVAGRVNAPDVVGAFVSAGAINCTGNANVSGMLSTQWLTCAQNALIGGAGIIYTAFSGNAVAYQFTSVLEAHVNATHIGTVQVVLCDERMKRDIGPCSEDALATLRRIELFSYNALDPMTRTVDTTRTETGFIAQRLLDIVPDAVNVPPAAARGAPETMTTVQLLPIVARSVRAIQQLAEQADTLAARIAALEGHPA